MALTTTRCDFTDPTKWVYDDDKIEIVNDIAKLKLEDNLGQTFTEDFADDTGFTYDSTRAEFLGGAVSQVDQAPTDSVIGATYTSSKNLSWTTAGSNLTATDYGSPVITNESLECIGANGVSYTVPNNFGIGSVKFKYTPNYTAGPLDNINMFNLINSANTNSRVTLTNSPSGNTFRVFIRAESGGVILATISFGSSASLIAGVEVEVLFTWDNTTGVCELYLDGDHLVTLPAVPWTHGTGEARIDIGASDIVYQAADANFRDVVVFNTVQETADYTPGYTVQEIRYLGSNIVLPEKTYAGVGVVQGFTSFTTIESDTPRYTINDLYFDDTWKASSGTWETASTETEINTNISTLPASDTVETKAIFNDSQSQMSIDNLILGYTGEIYPISVPTIAHAPSARCWMTELDSPFTESATIPAGDGTRYLFLVNGTKTYWIGSAWAASNGTYAQTNTAAEVNTNIDTLLDGTRVQVGIEIHLSSSDGSTTPTLTYLEIEADAALPDVDLEVKDINGYFYDCNLPVEGVKLYVRPYQSGYNNPGDGETTGVFNVYEYKLVATSVADGFYSGGIFGSPAGKYWDFLHVLPSGKKQSYRVDIGTDSVVDLTKQPYKVIND